MPRAGLDPEIVTEAAAVIVDADGLAALTLARLAADLGVAPPSLYKHVASLDDLILRVKTLSLRRLTDNLAVAALGRSGRQALLAVAEANRRFAIEHTGLYSLTQSGPNPGSTAQQAEASRVVEVLAAAIRSYNVPDELIIHAIRVVRAGLHGFADIEARGGFQMPLLVDESYLVLIDALDAALINLGRRAHN
jgi:AcrR family transcriptional regulator